MNRYVTLIPMTAAFAATLAACSEGTSYSNGSTAGVDDAPLVVDDIDIPSQAEEDAIAEAAINEANADAVFEELAREIESDEP